MSLLSLLAAGVRGGSLPRDPAENPALTTWRQIAHTEQGHNAPRGPNTWTAKIQSVVEASGVRMGWSGFGGQSGAVAWSLRANVEGTPLMMNGSDLIVVPANTIVWTDDIPLAIQPGQQIHFTVEALQPGPPNGVSDVLNQYGSAISMPWPIAVLGKTTTTEKALLGTGDSIMTQAAWFSPLPVPTINLGVPVTRWTTTADARYGGQASALMNAASHVVIQLGVNDIGGGDLTSLKTRARSCWDSHAAATSRPLYQTTPTPKLLGTTGDGCASSAGQTLGTWEPVRQNLNAWLRDGAPDAGGIRAGEPGHPLTGIIDLAVAVESPTEPGKWDWTKGNLGGDGVHPSDLGQSYMRQVMNDWLLTL